ncbi:MAG TPA: NYN domain-containing protein [Longimicrobium sp.]|nr:NYN domain-containing protein [Longimicrobium sp.]
MTYFSAFATHLLPNNPDVVKRHQNYVAALGSTGVEAVLSRFKEKSVTCPVCGNRFKRHEEKETDVALGLRLIELFARGACETTVLMTGDTDLVPAIRTAKRLYPARAVGVGFPFMRHNAELRTVADFAFNISQRDLQRAQLPQQIVWEGQVLTRPVSW